MLTPMNQAGGLPAILELRMTCTTEQGSRSWREAKFPFSFKMASHTGRNQALLGGNTPFTLIPYQNPIMDPQGTTPGTGK